MVAVMVAELVAGSETETAPDRVSAGQGPFSVRGRCWDRTSDLFRVNEAHGGRSDPDCLVSVLNSARTERLGRPDGRAATMAATIGVEEHGR